MSNLVDHARTELEFAGYTPESDDPMDQAIYRETIAIVNAFARCGHGGGSAPLHLDMIEKLLRFEPLGPITDNPDEWTDVSDFTGPGPTGVWQNRRDSRMFSEDGGKTYYSVDELRRGWRRQLFGRVGKKYKSIPHEEF